MFRKEKAYNQLLTQKLVPLFYHESMETSLQIVAALYESGVRMIEYTARGLNAIDNFKHLKKESIEKFPDLQLGIGTIKNEDQAKNFIAAGADFIVSPIMNKGIGFASHNAGLLWIPGCMTATEIAEAENAGATIIKIFPGNLLGPSYIKAIREIFPDLKFMPTGGVEPEEKNLTEWFQSGVVAVGMGSKLINKELADKGNFLEIRNRTEWALEMVNKIAAASH